MLNMFCFLSYGIALKCFRRSLECQLCVNNTSIFYSKLRLILEYCGNCFVSISSFYDKIEQYMSDIETDEFYDVELRKTLISNSKVFTNKGYYIIFNVSKYLHYTIILYFLCSRFKFNFDKTR